MTNTIIEHPILFSGPMVRAIMQATNPKTQTRRVVKLPNPNFATLENAYVTTWQEEAEGLSSSIATGLLGPERQGQYLVCNRVDDIGIHRLRCPYGQPGDRLWVRETWATVYDELDIPNPHSHTEYKADTNARYPGEWPDDEGDNPDCGKWQPSIHMPRWASRLTLEVLRVRVERLQDISEEDARAEGVEPNWAGPLDGWDPEEHGYIDYSVTDDEDVLEGVCMTAVESFQTLWDSINAKPKPIYKRNDAGRKVIDHYVSYPWEGIQQERTWRGKPWRVVGNPWVWVIEFKKLNTEGIINAQ
jgi:hypothetical protein